MVDDNHKILARISLFLIENPHQRFCQALYNLGINEHVDEFDARGYQKDAFKDNYTDTNEEVMKRIDHSLNRFRK